MSSTTLPSFIRTIDNSFTQTWFDMQATAADNILNSTVVWALLKMKGCFKPQRGSRVIERTVRYKVGPTPIAVAKGDTLPSGETETRTAAFWNYRRAVATHIQRDLMDDTENAGKYQIVNYVSSRTEEATDALKQKYEGDVLRAHVPDESGKEMQGLVDLVPPPATRTTGTYGNVARCSLYTTSVVNGITTDVPDPIAVNPWYTPRYQQFTLPMDVNLLSDMKHFFNVVTNQQEPPDIILTSQQIYELYEDWGLDAVQLIGNQKVLDLGFESLRFKGADLTYANAMAPGATLFDGTNAGYSGLTNAMLMLNSKWIDCVFDPGLWFEMTNWKDVPNQTARIAHILARVTIVSDQLRRHGLMYQ